MRLHLSMQEGGGGARSLARKKLRFHMPHGQKGNKRTTENRNNVVAKLIKTLKMGHIKK